MLDSNPLASITKGKKQLPPRIIIYGTEKIGKSTFAANAPNPIFLQTESGLDQIECASFPLATTFSGLMANVSSLIDGDHNFETAVLDSADWTERLIHDHICAESNAKSIELAGGGYGKGYALALGLWRELLACFDACRDRGMAIVMIAHSQIERFEDPDNPAYDRYSPKLHKKTSGPLVTEWADAVLFATKKVRIDKEKTGFNRERSMAVPIGRSGGERILRCVGGPTCVAGNRYNLPDELSLDWNAFAEAMSASV